MKRLLQLCLVWLGCLHLCGGSSGFLQVVAWTGMAVSYSARDGIAEGLSRTFDGEHPCPLCLAIAAAEREGGEEGDNDLPVPTALEKLVKDPMSLVEDAVPELPRMDNRSERMPVCASPSGGRGTDRPFVPPPRATA